MAKSETYAVIAVGGKQYTVREGEWLLVDRLAVEEGKTFHPELLMLGGGGEATLGDGLKGQQVTAKVTEHVLGKKVVVGKHKKRTGYRRRNGHRSRLSKIEIQAIGTRAKSGSSAPRKAKAEKETATAEKKTPARKKSEEKS